MPSGITSTGWPAVRDKCADLGIEFDAWQDGAGRLILAKREDGLYATTVGGVVISIPRQVGKTFLLGAIVFALCLLFPNLTVIWTAHRLRTAAETFSAMQGMARRAKIKPFVSKIVLGSGDEEIQFHNGSRIMFGARERGFGRGFSGVDVLVFDEAQILTENAIDDMVPATNQAPNPLILFTGTPPKPTDPGAVFRMKRAEALSGQSDDGVYIEFSADLGADPLDREQWRKANPSFPKRTPVAAMLRMKKNLKDDSFIREALGIWDEENSGGDLPIAAWLSLADPAVEHGTDVIFGVDVDENRVATISPAWARDGGWYGDLIDDPVPAHRLAERCKELVDKWGGRVAAPSALVDELTKAGCRVVEVKPSEWPLATAVLLDAIAAGLISHGNQAALNDAVRLAKFAPTSSAGTKALRLKDSPAVGPLFAFTRALYALGQVAPSAYEERELTWL